MLITSPARCFNSADAAAAHIAAIGGNDETTTYIVTSDPKGSGRALIEIHDTEDGMIGYIDF